MWQIIEYIAGAAWGLWMLWIAYRVIFVWPKPIEFEVTEEEWIWLLEQPEVHVLRMNHNLRTGQYWLYWFRSEMPPRAVDLVKNRRLSKSLYN